MEDILDEAESVRIITIVDNKTLSQDLQTAWGLSILVTIKGDKQYNVLMDTSGSVPAFFNNVDRLGIDVQDIDAIFITHRHGDHCGALPQVLQTIPRPVMVYVPSFRFFDTEALQRLGGIQVVTDRPTRLLPGCMSTGNVGGGIDEHSLVVRVKGKGLVILTGCSHPGVIRIIERAREASGDPRVYGVIGGFHVSGSAAKPIADYLKKLGVQRVSPCHCTSDDAKEIIKKTVGERYVANGSGLVLTI